MEITVTEIRALEGGAEAAVSVRICEGESLQNVKGSILAEMLTELRLPWEFTSPVVIDKNQCDELIFCIEKTAAIKKGLSLLEYAQNTAKTLKRKLVQKGYSAQASAEATDYLLSHGFINEKNDAQLFTETLATRKLYGKNRIKKELYAKGFDGDVIKEAMDLIDTDFAGICAKRMDRMGGRELLTDRNKRQKTVAALMRYGFTYEDIKEAAERLASEEKS